MDLLRRVARTRGLIVFTDADGAGFVIRNHLKSAIDGKYLKHAYTPDVMGKERRKAAPGKEGKLGVEGMTPQIILDALKKAGATIDDSPREASGAVSKQDLMELGLSGGPDSSRKRLALLRKLQLPERMSANAMLQALSLLYDKETLTEIVMDLEQENG